MSAPVLPITQVEFGRQALYARCVPPACPAVTPKTLQLQPQLTSRKSLPLNTAESLAPGEALAPAVDEAVPAEAALVKASASQTDEPINKRVVVRFAFGDATLSPAARALIDEAAKPLVSSRRIAITGRTDSVGPQQNNQWLATARANAVRDHLRARHPHLAAAVTLEAQGACCFVASNETPQGRAMNRRVEVVFERDAVNQ